ncbi:LacI family DNA-binding transcriptional regulator [Emcibacter nanhaiensis]|uniref:Substrate-binding domain-containing protein n=1 Tax=Emcibacter nanhaiensis TaxID=1505037 RepID=A0A501PF42_9PROT|nr:LacI family DNA-binding transcriptional regulator [Emcibacter nanhaiensis]TPD59040.1 substrate-binding domain-containing protein [Emcibacter nanhaiensis]
MAGTRPKKAITAYDVADHAGVSQSAVSRTFTPGASISAKTKAKVLASAKALGYRPNFIAKSLITRKSGITGVALGYADNPFYPALMEELMKRLSRQGRRFLLFNGDPQRDSDPELEEILRYQVDALILMSSTLSSHLAADCKDAGIPVVLINRRTEDGSTSSVTGDNFVGARKIAEFLMAGGHQRPAFLAGAENSSTNREREEGFRAGLSAAGGTAPLRACGNYQLEGARQATRELLASPDRPDAIFCANDHMAIGALEVARYEFGLDVGREISIVGFDDVDMAAWPSFDLTTYSQPVNEMAEAAMELIDLEEKAEPVHRRIPGELIIRKSARNPK